MFAHVLVDETVLADYLGERRAYLACRDRLVALELAGCARLLATPEACQRVLEEFRGVVPEEDLLAALDAVLRYVKICPSPEGSADVRGFCSVSRRAIAPAFTPDGFFDHLEREEGLAFGLVDF